MPLLGRVLGAIEHWLQPLLGTVRLDVDSDAVDALSADREALWQRVGAADFLTNDEKREAVGYGRLQRADGGTEDTSL